MHNLRLLRFTAILVGAIATVTVVAYVASHEVCSRKLRLPKFLHMTLFEQISARIVRTGLLGTRPRPVMLLNDQFDSITVGGGAVHRVTTTNVVKVRSFWPLLYKWTTLNPMIFPDFDHTG